MPIRVYIYTFVRIIVQRIVVGTIRVIVDVKKYWKKEMAGSLLSLASCASIVANIRSYDPLWYGSSCRDHLPCFSIPGLEILTCYVRSSVEPMSVDRLLERRKGGGSGRTNGHRIGILRMNALRGDTDTSSSSSSKQSIQNDGKGTRKLYTNLPYTSHSIYIYKHEHKSQKYSIRQYIR